MGFRDYKISGQALEDAKGLGLSGDVEEQLAYMTKFSANLTYPNANRRYKKFAFNLQDGVVVRAVTLCGQQPHLQRQCHGPETRSWPDPDHRGNLHSGWLLLLVVVNDNHTLALRCRGREPSTPSALGHFQPKMLGIRSGSS